MRRRSPGPPAGPGRYPQARLAGVGAVLVGLSAALVVGCSPPDADTDIAVSGGASSSSSSRASSAPSSPPSPGTSAAAGVDGGARLDTAGTLITLRQTPGVVSPTEGREVAAILTDLETFWSRQLDGAFTAPRGGYLLTDTADVLAPTTSGTATPGSSTPGSLSPGTDPAADFGCAGSADALRGNAFYCPGDDAIVVDAGALVPVVRSSYGIGGLAAALAHEYGHLIQARIGPTSAQQRDDPRRYPQVLIEAQADCAAGAYLGWAAGTSAVPGTARLRLPLAALPRSISPLVDFRDSATAATTDLFHGYGLDRLRAVVRGYQQGARACAAMTVGDLDLTLGRPGTDVPTATLRYPDLAAVTAAATAALRAFDPQAGTATANSADLAAAREIGQFAEGSATVLAVGRRQRPAAPACYLGAFTAARYGFAPARTLGAWRSDADEAMDLVIARSTGSATGWDRITGFVRGFGAGLGACR